MNKKRKQILSILAAGAVAVTMGLSAFAASVNEATIDRNRKDIPEGLYCYDIRHSDDGGRFCSVEPRVGVNHGGSVITDMPLDFGEKGYLSFTEDTEPNFLGQELTIGEYMRGEFEQTEAMEQVPGEMQL